MSRKKQDLGLKKPTNKSITTTSNKNKNIYTAPNINSIFEMEIKEGLILPPEIEKNGIYRCCSCRKSTNDIFDKTFPNSFSELYAGRSYHLPICGSCIDKLAEYYTETLGMTIAEMCRRICSLFDIYYCDELVKMTENHARPNRRMTFYIAKTVLVAFANKTYANTIAEEKLAEKEKALATAQDIPENENEISQKDLDFWGYVFTAEDIKYLNNEYDRWTATNECKNQAQVTIFRQISILSLQILKCYQEGKSSASYQKQLNDYMSSGNLQPKQNNENTFAETNTLALFLKRIENERPVAKCSPEFEDVDGIKRYISVWFLGHLAKMIGILDKMGTKWKKLYEDEIDALSAKPPTYFEGDENEETSFEDMFNK